MKGNLCIFYSIRDCEVYHITLTCCLPLSSHLHDPTNYNLVLKPFFQQQQCKQWFKATTTRLEAGNFPH